MLTNNRRNKNHTNDEKEGFRIVDNYKNKCLINDGKEGFRIVDNYKNVQEEDALIFDKNILAPDGLFNDNFGYSVSLSEISNKIVIGSYLNNTPPSGTDQGSIYIFNSIAPYQFLTQLTANDGSTSDRFGYDVAISNNKIIVGAIGDDTFRGKGYLYDATTFQLLTQLTAFDRAPHDQFGISVAINSTKIIIGAWGDNIFQGSVYLFNANNPYQFLTQLTATDGTNGDSFGHSVATDETSGKIIIGAFGNNSAYLYDNNGVLLTQLFASDGTTGDNFGTGVAISLNYIVVGAWNDGQTGSVYIFSANSPYAQLAKLKAYDGSINDGFGYNVAINETSDKIVIGASFRDNNKGSVYIYKASPPFNFIKKIVSKNRSTNDYFGSSVAIGSTNNVFVGANQLLSSNGFVSAGIVNVCN